MNELVQIIMQKTGLPQDKAQELVDTVITHLKGRLPESITSHLTTFLNGEGGGADDITEKAKSFVAEVGGLFGKSE